MDTACQSTVWLPVEKTGAWLGELDPLAWCTVNARYPEEDSFLDTIVCMAGLVPQIREF
jgi:hypothetical protein